MALAGTNGARLTIMDVTAEAEEAAEIEKRFGIDLNATLRERRLEQLDTLAALYSKTGVIYTTVLTETPFIQAVRAVKRNGYDLLAKAARPSAGIAERLFGSSDMHLLRKCPCPVWIDRPRLRDSAPVLTENSYRKEGYKRFINAAEDRRTLTILLAAVYSPLLLMTGAAIFLA